MKIKSVRKLLLILMVLVLVIPLTARAETLYVDRSSVDIKEGRGAFYQTIYTASSGEALEVLEKQGGWYKVSTPQGPGWVFGQALSAKKPTAAAGFLGTANTSELDKTAGFKGFDEPTEHAYVSANNLQEQMAQVDRLEVVPFSPSELRDFQRGGRVGPMGGAR
jgi:hypothetical protein